MADQPKLVRLDADVHAWLLLLSEKYQTTLSGVVKKLVTEQEPEIIELQAQINKLKEAALRDTQ